MTNKDSAGGIEGPDDGRLPGQEEACDPSCQPQSGPVREAGGTTGAGNLSPGQANRTGGATSGVNPDNVPQPPPRRGVPPSA